LSFPGAFGSMDERHDLLVKTPHPTTERPEKLDDGRTGLPGLPGWRGVYVLVAGSFLLWVGLLWGLSRLYS